jgi:DNA-binding NarL/FixJ family response regulator
MGIRRRPSEPLGLIIPPDTFPLEPETWQRVVAALRLSPQQARIAEQLLYGRQDKEIAAALGIRPPTLRTHLHRLLVRVEAADRTQLAVRLVGAARLLDNSLPTAAHQEL